MNISLFRVTKLVVSGEALKDALGIFWLPLPLLYRLDHVNIYLNDDYDDWCVLDAGICDERTIDLWKTVLSRPLGGSRLKRLIVTHHHPDLLVLRQSQN